MIGSESQLFVVGPPCETSVQSRYYSNATGTKSGNEIAVHRVFVDVDLDPAHRGGSAPVPFLESLCFPRLEFQVCVNLPLVGVVVGQSRMDLRQRQVAKLPHDFFRNQAHVVPLSDPAN